MKTEQESRRVLAALEPAIPVGLFVDGSRLKIEAGTTSVCVDWIPYTEEGPWRKN